MIRVACDKEWRAGENRIFDDIHLKDFQAMSHDVVCSWPLARYFDGAWIVKWAMRTAWTNRTKSARRRDKKIRRREQEENGIAELSNSNAHPTIGYGRRHRASKLGNSLYCIGGCKRLLHLEDFPPRHHGICTECSIRRRHDSPSRQSQGRPSSRAEQSGQLHRGTQQQSRSQTIPNQTYNVAESSRSVRRLNPHAVLPSSVTSHSDVGQHLSDRSTYGVPKPGRKKKPPPVPVRVSYTGQLSRSGPTVRRVNEIESEVESLRGVAYRGVSNNIPVCIRVGTRARSKAAPSQGVTEHEDNVDSRLSAEETVYEDEPVFRANAVTMRLIDGNQPRLEHLQDRDSLSPMYLAKRWH